MYHRKKNFKLTSGVISFALGLSFIMILVTTPFTTPTVQAEVPSQFEPQYAEAILAFNGRNYDRALKILDELLKEAPRTVEFLELKALALKSSQKGEQSAEVYKDLIRTKLKAKRPREELAPYFFELGLVHFNQKKNNAAKKYLRYSLKYGFNEGASHFFLGMIAFKDGSWGEAEENFQGVISSSVTDLKPAAYFYLAQVAIKTGYPAGATQNFNAARTLAGDLAQDTGFPEETRNAAKQIAEASIKALEPLNRNQWFGSIALLAAHDTNVLSLPDALVSTQASGQSSVKALMQAGIGYMTSPLRTFQLVPNFRASYNYNLNRETRTGEFFTNIASLYITHQPLNPLNFGLKIEGNLTFQNEVDPATDAGTFRPYASGLSVGPYAKYYLSRAYVLGGEIFLGTRDFKQDDQSAENLHRSADLLNTRVFLQNDTGNRWWNPTYTLGFASDHTNGSEYRSKSLSFGLSNIFYISRITRLMAGATLMRTRFPRQADQRKDHYLSLQISLTRKLSPRLTLLADLTGTRNQSTLAESFSYTRYVISAGVSYSLF